jgi:hypothetical protein
MDDNVSVSQWESDWAIDDEKIMPRKSIRGAFFETAKGYISRLTDTSAYCINKLIIRKNGSARVYAKRECAS